MSRYPLILVLLILAPVNGMASSQEYSLFKIELIMAQKGDPDAQFNVGHAYEQGVGVRRDMNKALHWYRKAADQNHDFAQYSIGLFYEQGLGVAQDTGQAKIWYQLAAKNGNELAKQKLLQKTPERKIPLKPVTKPTPVRGQAPLKISPPPRPKPTPKPKPKPTPVKVQTRPGDIMDIVMRGKWTLNGAPVDYLPSTFARCLQRGDDEIVCFTPELKRTLDDALITYTTKATIKDFTKEGHFTIDYLYNVTDISSSPTPGPHSDLHGLQKQKGWQKTRLNLQCSADHPRRLNCKRGEIKYAFTR